MIARRAFITAATAATILPARLSDAADRTGQYAAELARIERDSGGRLGAVIRDTKSGFQVDNRGGERFPMCSTFKLLAAAAILSQVDGKRDTLDRTVQFSRNDVVPNSPVTEAKAGGPGMTLSELCQAALNYSDNTAGNLLLSELGGPDGVTRYARSIGDRETRLDRWETALNEALLDDPRDTTTPRAMLDDLHGLVLGPMLSTDSRMRLQAWLLGCRTGDARLKAGVPADWRVGDKTGSGDRGTSNDVAVLWRPNGAPVIVTAYLTDTKAGEKERNATIAAVGRLAASLAS